MKPSSNIRPAEERDLEALGIALERLSQDLGDPHRAGTDTLHRALFGMPQATWAQVAEGTGGIAGVVLFAPVFSTVRGGAGVFVSDLWVESAQRGRGLGLALLRSAANTAGVLWDAGFMRLSVHDNNARARALYQDMGFAPASGEAVMVLTGQAFQQVRRTT